MFSRGWEPWSFKDSPRMDEGAFKLRVRERQGTAQTSSGSASRWACVRFEISTRRHGTNAQRMLVSGGQQHGVTTVLRHRISMGEGIEGRSDLVGACARLLVDHRIRPGHGRSPCTQVQVRRDGRSGWCISVDSPAPPGIRPDGGRAAVAGDSSVRAAS